MAGAHSQYYSEVLLGYVDERIDGKYEATCDYTTNKIGGSPNWMPHCVPSINDLSCSLCKSFLSLICQVYAPLENSCLHRTLYLFACLRKPCWNTSISWKCFRSEVEDISPKPISVIDLSNTASHVSLQTTDWAVDADEWGSSEDNDDDENGNVADNLRLKDFSINDNYATNFNNDYENANKDDDEDDSYEEEEISSTSTSDFSASTDMNTNANSDVVAGAAGGLIATAVIEEEENEGDTNVVIIDSPDEAAQAAATASIPSLFFPTDNVNTQAVISDSCVFIPYFLAIDEDIQEEEDRVSEHERRLLWEFRNKESTEDDDEEKGLSHNNRGGACSGNDADGYEKAVPRHGDIFFHKFLTIVQKNPGQVLRYSRGDNKGPLLMSKLSSKNKTPDKCSYCGGPLVFEFQVLSSLLSFLKTPNPGEGEIEFGNVIIFTCKKSCSASSTESLRMEHILVQAEPM